jgi:type II secretory pathway pseudopilin PulG
MSRQNKQSPFYVLRSPFNPNYYSVHSSLTDRLLLEKQSMERVKEFLTWNDPSHPILRVTQTDNQSNYNLDVKDYPYTDSIYYNGENKVYPTYNIPPDQGYTLNRGINTYTINSWDNDTIVATATNIIGDCDSDYCDSDQEQDCYGDSNHIPYITGKTDNRND